MANFNSIQSCDAEIVPSRGLVRALALAQGTEVVEPVRLGALMGFGAIPLSVNLKVGDEIYLSQVTDNKGNIYSSIWPRSLDFLDRKVEDLAA